MLALLGGCGVPSDSWQTRLNWFAGGIVLKTVVERMTEEWSMRYVFAAMVLGYEGSYIRTSLFFVTYTCINILYLFVCCGKGRGGVIYHIT